MGYFIRFYQGYGRKEREGPRSLQMLTVGILSYFIFVILYTSGYKAFSLLFLFAMIAFSAIISFNESDYGYVFFAVSLLPLFLARTVLKFPGVLITFTIIIAISFYLIFNPGYIPFVTDYKIPENTSPAEAAFLLSRDVGPQELISTTFSLYLRGYLNIENINNQIFFVKKADYENDPTLFSYEKFILNKIFLMTNINIMVETGIVYKAENFPDKVHSELVFKDLGEWTDLFKSKLLESMREEKPILKKYAFETKPIFLISSVTYLLGITLIPQVVTPEIRGWFIVENVVSASIYAFLSFMPILPLTRYGKEVYARILGFREFMKRVEKPRLFWLIKEEKIGVFELLNYLYALNLLTPFRWVLDYVRTENLQDEAPLFTKLLTEVQLRWTKGKPSWQE
ncbi:MAG: DUF2207 family protein [Candidatus Hydrothermia bacterium]